MPETTTTTEVRADIEQTRARMSNAIAELERKVDFTQKIREYPLASIGIAFGAGVALSASRVDVKAARVTSDATKQTGTKLGSALDGVVAALVTGVTAALHQRIDGAVKEVVSSIRGSDTAPSNRTSSSSFSTADGTANLPIRAD
jgi:predicted anti-sigma-YlaC factor YlaD